MSNVSLQIDGKAVSAKEGMTLLEAARGAGISIPTVCYHEKLEPFGGCRLCVVEVEAGGRKSLVAACTHPVQQDQTVNTRSKQIDGIRKVLTEQLLAYAPESEVLQALAREYKADKDRFPREPSFCILCGLCVRYCAEVKQKYAVGFVDRGPSREISFVPELAATECWDCKQCFPLCPTSALQAAFVLTRSLRASPSPARPALNKQVETAPVPE
ncbi:MAG: (2Fe-2S)-binding protein [Betaproteobacteria bacterium RIFCSPLOWO2_12_FULL_63_13]|nr:MAG: (2Fe-2S)-binding protein [Betaproteobacteria bacterium RIFCSPLOWO2_02_FULL_63_19]OGA43860.1 MAG: (2Fe-2S)-binding protein [Betaproteobacteria bacterium RIFCSPLOWO2_12_FULL_63_13]